MNTREASMAVITLSLNDPCSTRATLKSISSQTFSSISKIVIDSSDPLPREQVKKYCAEQGADYHWVPAQGIYAAMRHGLGLVSSQSACLFLNSGDFFFSSNSAEKLLRGLEINDGTSAAWAIGGLSIQKDGEEIGQYFLPGDQQIFDQKIRRGELYLPHPSTIYRPHQLRQAGAFTDRLQIASDFATGLRMYKKFGPPVIVDGLISVFAVGGTSSQHPVLIQFENMAALTSAFGWRVFPRQFLRAVIQVSLYFLRKVRSAIHVA